MLYVPSDNLSSPFSLLEAFTLMNTGYYKLFASYYYVNGIFFSFDGFSLAPGRFAY